MERIKKNERMKNRQHGKRKFAWSIPERNREGASNSD